MEVKVRNEFTVFLTDNEYEEFPTGDQMRNESYTVKQRDLVAQLLEAMDDADTRGE